MLNLSEQDIAFVKNNLENADRLLQSEDVNEILIAIDELILFKGFISHEEGYNDFGREAQEVYDNIYDNN